MSDQPNSVSGSTPPRWATALLKELLPADRSDDIAGDLLERYLAHRQQTTRWRADWQYVRDVLSFIRPGVVRYKLKSSRQPSPATSYPYPTPSPFTYGMLTNYLTVARRNLLRQKLTTFINTLGLSLGLASCLLILLYVQTEWSYDTFHAQAPNLFRVVSYEEAAEGSTGQAPVYAAVGPTLKNELPEVADFTRLFARGSLVVNVASGRESWHNFTESRFFFAEPSLFSLFSFQLLRGNPQTALAEPFTVVLSATKARTYFGKLNPLGKTIQIDDQFGQSTYRVTGVVADVPPNSHLHFDALTSFSSLSRYLGPLTQTDWSINWFYTYVRLQTGTQAQSVEAKLPSWLIRHKGQPGQQTPLTETLRLQAITDIHLQSHLAGEVGTNGDATTVRFLLLVAGLILAMAWFNYVNLATAQSLQRAKEVGVRKTLGAQKHQIRGQFFVESILVHGLALLGAACFVALGLPLFRDWLDRPLLLSFDPQLLVGTGVVLVLSMMVVGWLPATFLATFQPIQVLKGRGGLAGRGLGGSLRRTLVVLQFTITLVLLAFAQTIYWQLGAMNRQPLGLQLTDRLVVKAPSVHDSLADQKAALFKQDLLRFPAIKAISQAQYVPGETMDAQQGTVRRLGSPQSPSLTVHIGSIDEGFFATYGIPVLAGRSFQAGNRSDSAGVVLNQTASRVLGFSSPQAAVGQRLWFPYGGTDRRGGPVTVLGVTRDYHQRSLKEAKLAQIFRLGGGHFTVQLADSPRQTTDKAQIRAFVQQRFRHYYPLDPFELYTVADHYARQYEPDVQLGRVVGSFALIAIGIACLGLLGLVFFSTRQRAKEVSIRKIHGAPLGTIWLLLTRDFLKLIALASLVALPLEYGLIQRWLGNFVFRPAGIGWLLITPLLYVGLISLLTVSYHAYRTTRLNPVRFLRDE